MTALREQHGFTLVELLVSMLAGMAVLSAIVTITTAATHNQDRIAKRVEANQRVRPVVTRIVDLMHSSCVAPRVAPVLTGSSGTQLDLVSRSGSAVSPTPELHRITLSGTTLRERIYPAVSGVPPVWTYSATASSDRILLTDVSGVSGAVFRYYDYVNGALRTTPLGTPLSAGNAARTAYVTVSLNASPTGGASTLDAKSPITVSDSASLRLESAGPVPNQDNLPCA